MIVLVEVPANFSRQNKEVIDYILIFSTLVYELLEVHKITTFEFLWNHDHIKQPANSQAFHKNFSYDRTS